MKLKALRKVGMLFALLSCPAVSAFAQPFPDPCYFAGWSAGVGLGVTTLMSNTTNNTLAPTMTNYTSGEIYKFGPLGNIYVGYAGVWDNLYLGAELGLNFLGANKATLHGASQSENFTSTTDDIGSADITLKNSIQTYTKVTRNTVEPVFDIKPGVLLAPNGLLYARLGVSFNDIETKSYTKYRTNGTIVTDVDDVVHTSSDATSTSLNNSKSKNVTGFRLGFGLEYMINPNLGIGSDYIYTFYNNVNTGRRIDDASLVSCNNVTGCYTANNGTLKNNTKAKVADQEVLLQLIYHFNC